MILGFSLPICQIARLDNWLPQRLSAQSLPHAVCWDRGEDPSWMALVGPDRSRLLDEIDVWVEIVGWVWCQTLAWPSLSLWPGASLLMGWTCFPLMHRVAHIPFLLPSTPIVKAK